MKSACGMMLLGASPNFSSGSPSMGMMSSGASLVPVTQMY
jgi:hypothetical protein